MLSLPFIELQQWTPTGPWPTYNTPLPTPTQSYLETPCLNSPDLPGRARFIIRSSQTSASLKAIKTPVWESFGTNYFFHLADSYHRCNSPPAQRGAKWEIKTHSHSAAVWVQPSTPSAPCNFPKLPFNKENMGLISGFDMGQTVAAHSHLTDRRSTNFCPKKEKKKKKKKKSDKSRAELAGPRRIAKEKIASIKSNPSWKDGLQNQFQVTICMITLICLFFFSNYISIPAT